MHRLRRTGRILAVVILFMLLVPQPAHAYLDPGTGSYLLQLGLAAVLGLALGLKVFWRRIWGFFTGLFSRGKAGEGENG